MNAGAALQAAAMAALANVAGLSGVYPGAPVQGAVPFAIVEAGAESDWGHKSGAGRELRLAVSIFDEGERPERVHALSAAAGAALEGMDAVAGWSLVTFRLVRARTVKERSGRWAALIEFRARMLAL